MMKMMVTMRKNFRPLAGYSPIFTQYTTSAPKRKPDASAGMRRIFEKLSRNPEKAPANADCITGRRNGGRTEKIFKKTFSHP